MSHRNQTLFFSILTLVSMMLIGIMIFLFFSENDYSVNQKRNAHLIGASYMTMNNEFYEIMSEEIKERIEAEGDQWILRDPALDVDRQIEQISEMLDLGIDVLVVAPVDWTSLTSVLEKAKSQGVLVVVVDTNVADEPLVDCTITSDNYQAGVLVGQYFLTQCEKAKVLVMTHDTAKSGQDRVQGFLDTVTKREGIEIVKKIDCEGQLEIAVPKLKEAMEEGVEFDNVFCLNDLSSVGVVAVLEEKRMLDHVGVYGVDASPDSKALIKEGMMKASSAQFPSEIGKKAADAIYGLLEGETVEKKILVPVRLVTPENVEELGIDRWQ